MRSFIGRLAFEGRSRLAAKPLAARIQGRHVLHRGYIANRDALAEKARREEACVNGLDDAELFALATKWWGAEFPKRVLGEYAVAIYDSENEALLLAHDELGLMPVFFARSDSAIIFSTHLEDLVLETGAGEIDEDYIADWLMRAEHSGARTPYAHIRRLQPGESAVWRRGRWSTQDVWTLGTVAPLRESDEAAAASRLRELVFEAVSAAAPRDRKIWCELSGGLDSSSVVAVASRLGMPVETLSFVYSRSSTAGEQCWIDVMRAAFPMPGHAIDVDVVPPFSRLPSRFLAEPSAWTVNDAFDGAYTGLLERHGVEIVLTGEGGDAVLCGDVQRPFFLADRLLQGDLAHLWQDAGLWGAAAENQRSAAYALLAFAIAPLFDHLRSRLLEHHSTALPWIDRRFAERMHVSRRQRTAWLPKARSIGAAYMLQRIMRGANLISTHTHHRKIACEFRNPLLHRPLIEFMLAVPWALKLAPATTRPLQRRAFAGLLPNATLGRTDKGGSDQPWYAGLNGGMAVRQALTERPRAIDRGWFDLQSWREAVQRARVGSTIGLGHFRASAALELWLQQLERIPRSGAGELRKEDEP